MHRHLSRGCAASCWPTCRRSPDAGGSHDQTDLLPLKAGVAIMALGAMSAEPDLKIKIVPVGLSCALCSARRNAPR